MSSLAIFAVCAASVACLLLWAKMYDKKKWIQTLKDIKESMSDENWDVQPEGVFQHRLPFYRALPIASLSSRPQTPFYELHTQQGSSWIFSNTMHILSMKRGPVAHSVIAVMEIEWPYQFWVRIERRWLLVAPYPDEHAGSCESGGKCWLISSMPDDPIAIELLHQIAVAMSNYKYSFIQIKDGFLILGGFSCYSPNAFRRVRDMSRTAHSAVTELVKAIEE